jgi:hypothetical protein
VLERARRLVDQRVVRRDVERLGLLVRIAHRGSADIRHQAAALRERPIARRRYRSR